MTSPFESFSTADVQALIAEYPLAWVAPRNGPASVACLLPLLGEYGEDGALLALVGHAPRRFALVEAASRDPGVTILFTGPQGYVSPEHAGRRDWGPTWNFAQVAVEGDLTLLPDTTADAIDRLVDTMEEGRPAPWRAEELGDRYPGMLARVIGFRIAVTSLTGRFKLGQDERPAVLQSILDRHPDAALVAWMRRANGL